MKQTHLSIIPRSDIDPQEWNLAVDQSDEAWFWHLSGAINGYSTWDNYSDLSFAVRNSARDNSIVALVPLHKARTRLPYFSRLESTGGPSYSNLLQQKERKAVAALIFETLTGLARDHKALRIDISLSPLSPAIRHAVWPMVNPLTSLGFTEASTMSWIVPMAELSEENLWSKVAHRTRKAVNKARRTGYSVRIANASDLKLYMELHRETAKRNALPEKPLSYAQNIIETLVPQGLARVYIAEKGGQAMAFHAFALYKEAAIYWTTGCTSNALRDGVNNFLLWEAMRDLRKDGISWLECGEALPNSNLEKLQRINDFKRSFGGDLYPYYRGSLIIHPILGATLGVLRAFRS